MVMFSCCLLAIELFCPGMYEDNSQIWLVHVHGPIRFMFSGHAPSMLVFFHLQHQQCWIPHRQLVIRIVIPFPSSPTPPPLSSPPPPPSSPLLLLEKGAALINWRWQWILFSIQHHCTTKWLLSTCSLTSRLQFSGQWQDRRSQKHHCLACARRSNGSQALLFFLPRPREERLWRNEGGFLEAASRTHIPQIT